MFEFGEPIYREHIFNGFQSVPLLDAALSLTERKNGDTDKTPEALHAVIIKLQACGFHAVQSFTRREPYWQNMYVVPFFRDFFDPERKMETAEEVFPHCSREYENLYKIYKGTGGDLEQARQFLLKLQQAVHAQFRFDHGRRYLAA